MNLGGPSSFDFDKWTGAVIDAYTLAPNDEEEKRAAVNECLQRIFKESSDLIDFYRASFPTRAEMAQRKAISPSAIDCVVTLELPGGHIADRGTP